MRRPLKPKQLPTSKYMYVTTPDQRAIDQCETSEETGGFHVVTPDVWPPRKKRGMTEGADNPVDFPCTLCGSTCLVYEDNDPELSGVKIVLPEKREAGAKK